ncbi:MAG TPA: glycoside hydrolase family 2 TIM barrel-domain containing protein [Fimbriimonadaceae bacterium]|nr:glycoside hydrolase family 2 TIM barrel-domain containing protein [Fimbriimonadaceae bacterium]
MLLLALALLPATGPRVRIDLNQEWEFRRASDKWSRATLPHSPWTRPLGADEIWQGVTEYRRGLDETSQMRGRRVLLTLEAAMQSSEVMLNGQRVGGRQGGYLPVVIDLTGKLKPHNEIRVRVDNSNNPLIPPGKPQKELDFMYGCGLYRNAYLTVTGPLYITDSILEDKPHSGGIYVTEPLVSARRSVVRVRTHIRNSSPRPRTFRLVQLLKDRTGRIATQSQTKETLAAGTDTQFAQDLTVANPKLWSPDSPYLYSLETEIEETGRDEDEVVTRVGIRSVEVSREKGFLLNGRPVRLVGTNRHQDYPWIGIALSDAAQYRDAVLIKRAGHNIVRLSHYPQSPAFLDACDDLGIMTIPCAAGWQFMNNDPVFRARVDQDIRELIRRDRNHPSAVLWETNLNETYAPNDVADEWNVAAKEESLDGRILTSGDGRKGSPWDVIYNQWRDKDMSRPQDANPEKPGYIREYGDYEFGGAHSSSRVRFADGQDALMRQAWNEVWSLNRYRPQYPWTMGAGTWVMFDHNVPWDFRISACGLADLFRRPKPAYWFFASQEAKAPMAKVETYRDKIVVFTNCDEVALSLDGKRLATERPRGGPATAYDKARPFDGSNTGNLAHPPVVFERPRADGVIRVDGFAHGRLVASDVLRPAGKPVRLKVWEEDMGRPLQADGADAVFVRAAVVDGKGVIVTGAEGSIRFAASGAGTIAGEAEVPLEMGVASELIRGTTRPGAISVSARLVGGNLAGSSVVRSR